MKTFVSFASVALAMAMTVPAGATNCSNLAYKKLQFQSDDTGGILWQTPRVDSPRDANKSRIMVTVLFQTGDDYALAFGRCTGIEGKLLGQVKNLSFDFMNETGNPVHTGAGAPRYSVDLDTDGDNVADTYAYLSAFYCQDVMPEDTTWSRADFTGRVSVGCGFYTSEGGPYASDGTNSAWATFATAHPTWKVLQAYLVMDEEGTAFVDRLAFQNQMFTAPSTVVNCPAEGSC